LLVDPREIADRYQVAVSNYLNQLKSMVLESAVDYHSITIDENYEQVLFRFLARRSKTRGVR
jgi:predicted DNA-binding ArsR family transcriptional regulator